MVKPLPASTFLALSAIAVTAAAMVASALLVPSANATPSFSQLTKIRVGRHTTYDRVVLDFRGPAPTSFRDTWPAKLVADPSDRPIALPGSSFLSVREQNASAVDLSGRPTYPGPMTFRTFALGNVEAVTITGDFEHVLGIGIGVRHRSWVHVFGLTHPSRLVVDIGHQP